MTALFADDRDRRIRSAAFGRLEELGQAFGGALPWRALNEGFVFEGTRVPWIGQQGIVKPAGMRLALAITTSPKNPYADEVGADGFVLYHYQGDDPLRYDNVALRAAGLAGAPLVYFHGLAPGWYQAFWPAFVQHDDVAARMFHVAIDQPEVLRPDLTAEVVDEVHRRYTTQLARKRLHQAVFRERVLAAYATRCAICRLRHRELLDAAHIVGDTHPEGRPVVPNGLSLCKIHHSAFDTNIVGVRPDCVVEVRRDVLEEIDGPMLRHGIQELHGARLYIPRRSTDRPNEEFLERRYEAFRAAG